MSISRGGSLSHVEQNALGYIRSRRLNEPIPSQQPTLEEVQPTAGLATGGTAITVIGTNLIGTTSFKLDTTSCTSVVVAADGNSLTAVSPSHAAGSVSATVTTPLGSATLPDAFRYTTVPANPPPSVSYLIVAGGGSGGTTDTGAAAPSGTILMRPFSSGGGAGGGVVAGTISVAKGISYPVGIGAGGQSINLTGRQGSSGGNSSFRGLIANGGGGGGGGTNDPSAIAYGAAGGSSGGGSALDLLNTGVLPTLGYTSLPTNINNQGNIGGQGYSIKTLDPTNPIYRAASGGGGGRNTTGSTPSGSNGYLGIGGTGLVSSITGSSSTYGSGGGGGRLGFTAVGNFVAGGTGGGSGASGGLVNGSADTGAIGTNGTLYGGGGGGSYTNEVGTFKQGGNGYQGVVIIRYSSSYDQLVNFDTDFGTYALDGSSHVYVIQQPQSIMW